MSKTLFSFLIGELKVIRLICKQSKCGAIAEIPLERLGITKTITCPSCKLPLEDSADGPLMMLGKAIRAIENNSAIDVEFVLPVKE